MKVSRAKFDAHHRYAARLICEHGFDAAALSDVMREAGLTHGALYGHFPSKEGLSVSAVAAASTDIVAYWRSAVEALSEEGLAAIAEGYLDTRHVAALGPGCPVAALGVDVARAALALAAAGRSADVAVAERALEAHVAEVGFAVGLVDPDMEQLGTIVFEVGASLSELLDQKVPDRERNRTETCAVPETADIHAAMIVERNMSAPLPGDLPASSSRMISLTRSRRKSSNGVRRTTFDRKGACQRSWPR